MAHDVNQARPIDLRGALELARPRVGQPRNLRDEQDVAGIIESATTGPAEHLQQLIRLHVALEISSFVTRVRDQNRAHGKVNSRGQSHRCDDDVKLAGLREWLDQTCAHRVTQTAVMISNARAQKFGETFSGERFLRRRKWERIANRHRGSNCLRHFFGGISARRENQNWRQIRAQGATDHPRPKIFRVHKLRIGKIAQIDFFQRYGTFVMRNQNRIAPDALQPRDDVLRISHAAAEQKQLRVRRREREREFVVNAAHRIADHLIFVDHQKLRTLAPKKARALRFQSGDDHFRVCIQRQIASRDADIPPARAPFGELVVRERARRHGENCLPFQRRVEQLEDVSFARAGRRLHDDVAAIAQSAHGFLLPKIRHDQIDLETRWHRRISWRSEEPSTKQRDPRKFMRWRSERLTVSWQPNERNHADARAALYHRRRWIG